MIVLNVADRGMDDATLGYIIKSTPADELGTLLKSLDFNVEERDEDPPADEYEPISKAEIFDLVKGRKIKAGSAATKSGKTVQKVQKQIIVHRKNGTTFMQNRMVNADVAEDATLLGNMLKGYDDKVSMIRRVQTEQCTEYAANIEDMKSTPEGLAAYKAICAASAKGRARLTDGMSYTDIRYCPDPVAGVIEGTGETAYYPCLAIAKNPTDGKDTYIYSQQFVTDKTKDRHECGAALAAPYAQQFIGEMLEDGDFPNEDVRDCLKLMYYYGMKSGNEKGSKKNNQAGVFVTAGATTLRAGNVFLGKKRVTNPETGKSETVERVYLQFYQQGERGNKEHQQSIEITDPALAARLKEKKLAAKGDDDRIFSCTRDDTNAVCKGTLGCNNEDLRAAYGYMQFRKAQRAKQGNSIFEARAPERTDEKTGKTKKMTKLQIIGEIRSYLMEQMGTTDSRSVERYINRGLIELFMKSADGKLDDKKKAAAAKKKQKKADAQGGHTIG